jgi:hypothetical protein
MGGAQSLIRPEKAYARQWRKKIAPRGIAKDYGPCHIKRIAFGLISWIEPSVPPTRVSASSAKFD